MSTGAGRHVEVLVAGGGPVGLAAAIEARLRGLDVVVLDPREAPADKACGEGLMPSGLRSVHRLGVDPAGEDIFGISYHQGVRVAEAYFSSGTGRGVRRTVLHASLARRAAELGIPVQRERVADVRQDDDGVQVGPWRARWLIGADGLHSTVRRRCGLEVEPRGPRRYGLQRHVVVPPWNRLVEVHWAPSCEAYVTPVGPGLVGVAVLCPPGGSFESWLSCFPELRERLQGADVETVRGAGPLRQRVSSPRAGRVLLVGDAAGYVDALTGEGLTLGLLSARLAVRAVVEDRPEAYDGAYRRAARASVTLTRGLLAVTRVPAARRTLVPAAAGLPGVMRALVDVLA